MKVDGRFIFAVAAIFISGCAKDQNLERINREQAATIQGLSHELKRVNAELEEVTASRTDFEKAKAKVEKKMQQEMAEGDLSVGLESRGLVVTVLDRILFD